MNILKSTKFRAKQFRLLILLLTYSAFSSGQTSWDQQDNINSVDKENNPSSSKDKREDDNLSNENRRFPDGDQFSKDKSRERRSESFDNPSASSDARQNNTEKLNDQNLKNKGANSIELSNEKNSQSVDDPKKNKRNSRSEDNNPNSGVSRNRRRSSSDPTILNRFNEDKNLSSIDKNQRKPNSSRNATTTQDRSKLLVDLANSLDVSGINSKDSIDKNQRRANLSKNATTTQDRRSGQLDGSFPISLDDLIINSKDSIDRLQTRSIPSENATTTQDRRPGQLDVALLQSLDSLTLDSKVKKMTSPNDTQNPSTNKDRRSSDPFLNPSLLDKDPKSLLKKKKRENSRDSTANDVQLASINGSNPSKEVRHRSNVPTSLLQMNKKDSSRDSNANDATPLQLGDDTMAGNPLKRSTGKKEPYFYNAVGVLENAKKKIEELLIDLKQSSSSSNERNPVSSMKNDARSPDQSQLDGLLKDLLKDLLGHIHEAHRNPIQKANIIPEHSKEKSDRSSNKNVNALEGTLQSAAKDIDHLLSKLKKLKSIGDDSSSPQDMISTPNVLPSNLAVPEKKRISNPTTSKMLGKKPRNPSSRSKREVPRENNSLILPNLNLMNEGISDDIVPPKKEKLAESISKSPVVKKPRKGGQSSDANGPISDPVAKKRSNNDKKKEESKDRMPQRAALSPREIKKNSATATLPTAVDLSNSSTPEVSDPSNSPQLAQKPNGPPQPDPNSPKNNLLSTPNTLPSTPNTLPTTPNTLPTTATLPSTPKDSVQPSRDTKCEGPGCISNDNNKRHENTNPQVIVTMNSGTQIPADNNRNSPSFNPRIKSLDDSQLKPSFNPKRHRAPTSKIIPLISKKDKGAPQLSSVENIVSIFAVSNMNDQEDLIDNTRRSSANLQFIVPGSRDDSQSATNLGIPSNKNRKSRKNKRMTPLDTENTVNIVYTT